MDINIYMQYSNAIKSGRISHDALKRIIKHDKVSLWYNAPGTLARIKVLEDCDNKIITSYKLFDEPTDELYGNSWPLPISFNGPTTCPSCEEENKKQCILF